MLKFLSNKIFFLDDLSFLQLLALSILIAPLFSFASSPEPCRQFVSDDSRSFLLESAYKAADLVVIGQVAYGKSPLLKIKNKIKGSEKSSEIQLIAPRCQGTACSGGFSVAQKTDLLFLLKRQPDAIYDSVSGNGNYSCPVVFEVQNDAVKIGKKNVAIKSLEKYLQLKPDAIPLFDP